MKGTQKIQIAAALLALAVLMPGAALSEQASTSAPAQCVFSGNIVVPDDGGAPEYKPMAVLPCPLPESVYAVCAPTEGNWLQFKQADTFAATAALPGADMDYVAETKAPGVWALGNKPLVLTLWKPAEESMESDFGITAKALAALCPPPPVKKGEPAPAISLSLVWVPKEPDAEPGAIAAAALPVVQKSAQDAPPEPPKITPPTANEVKDTVRNEWPNRFPQYQYMDGYVTDAPVCTQPNGDVFIFSMNVTIQDPDGNELICDLKSVKVRKMETGGLIVLDLSVDLLQSCR